MPKSKRISAVVISLLACLLALVSCAKPNQTTSGSSPTESAAPQVEAEPTPTPTPTPTPETLPDTTVLFAGDLLWHNTLWVSAGEDHKRTGKGEEFDFEPMFADVIPLIQGADAAICHGEVPFAPWGGPYKNYPLFAAPPEIAGQLKEMGWDLCTTSSNHSLDQGFEGLAHTIEVYDEAGILHTGTWATEESRDVPVIYTTPDGVKISVVGGTYGTNGIPLPKGKEWSVAMLDADDIIARAAAAKEAGADIVIGHIHGGDEYVTKPNAQQVEVATKLTASPHIDMVMGQHVHVVQPWTEINGKLVIYGMGNLVAQHLRDVPRGQEGVIALVTFTQSTDGTWSVKEATYIPTLTTHYSSGNPVRLIHLNNALDEGRGDKARQETALKRTREAVLSLGITGIKEG